MMVTHGFASFNHGLRAYFFGLAALAEAMLQPADHSMKLEGLCNER